MDKIVSHTSIKRDYSPWGHKEAEMTEQLSLSLHFHPPLQHTDVILLSRNSPTKDKLC